MRTFLITTFASIALAGITMIPASAQSNLSGGDRQFLVQAAASGASEVRSARMELHNRDRNAAGFAQRMIADHTKANAKLAAIAKQLGAASIVASAAAGAPNSAPASGQEYLTAQVSAHQEALTLFQREAASGRNASLRAFAKAALPTLRVHLALAQRLSGKP